MSDMGLVGFRGAVIIHDLVGRPARLTEPMPRLCPRGGSTSSSSTARRPDKYRFVIRDRSRPDSRSEKEKALLQL
jgi:hypothetical protein